LFVEVVANRERDVSPNDPTKAAPQAGRADILFEIGNQGRVARKVVYKHGETDAASGSVPEGQRLCRIEPGWYRQQCSVASEQKQARRRAEQHQDAKLPCLPGVRSPRALGHCVWTKRSLTNLARNALPRKRQRTQTDNEEQR